MNTPEALDEIVAELVRAGLPAQYAQSAVAEFRDHHDDLIDELRRSGMNHAPAVAEASRLLGEPRMLVKKTIQEYRRRSWCGRWPMITFLLGPIPLLCLTWVASWIVLLCLGWPLYTLGLVGDHQPDGTISTGEWLVNQFAIAWFGFATPAVTMFALARLAKQAALNWKWIAVSACVLGLTSGMVGFDFPHPELNHTFSDGRPVPADQMMLIFGIPLFAPSWLAAWNWYTRDLLQISQVMLPVVVVLALLLRAWVLSFRSQRLVADC